MNIRKIITFNNLRRQFTTEELTFADALYHASESDRELIVESLQPEKSTRKAAKKSASKKSSRASGMAQAIKESLDRGRAAMEGGGGGGSGDQTCQHRFNGGGSCKRSQDHNVHHLQTDSLYHPFQPAAPTASDSSSANGGAGSGTQNLEDETESAAVAVGGLSE